MKRADYVPLFFKIKMEKTDIERLEKLLCLQKEKEVLTEFTKNKRIEVGGIYRDYFKEKGTTVAKPGYAEVVFIPAVLFIVALTAAIAGNKLWLIIGALVVFLPLIAVLVFLRRRARRHWKKVNEQYKAEQASALNELNNKVLPAIYALREYLPEEIINQPEKAKNLILKLRCNSFGSNLAVKAATKKCAFCGTENAATAKKCESCGAPL